MGFSRANWHSGLEYKQTCPTCKTTVTYTDYDLDYRPWFADGFVYCPTCKKPLRHNENYATTNNDGVSKESVLETNFCPSCGNKVNEGDNFCAKCGYKL